MAALLPLAALAAAGPEQLSLALTANGPTEMGVTWVSLIAYTPTSSGAVTWAPSAQPSALTSAPAETKTYTAGFGWTGTLCAATMTGLTPGASYTYTVTDATGNRSAPFSFKAAPMPSADGAAFIAVLADMGTIELLGFEVAAEVIREHAVRPFDALTICGDLSYATVDPPNFEVQGLWDAWGQQNEPFAATAPFQMTTGNHESTPGTVTNASGTFPQEFAAFATRFRMPANGNGNFRFSWSYASAFFISFDTEHDFSAGSPQVAWFAATLAAVNRSVYPWLFVTMHHPILSSDSDEVPDHIPGGPLSRVLEPLLLKYKVDVVFQGHQHVYERTASVFNGTVVQLPDASNVYHAPAAPIYIVQGTSGAVLDGNKWIAPTNWSLVREGNYYGFGRMSLNTTAGNRVLHYEFVDTTGIVRDTWSAIKPAAAAPVQAAAPSALLRVALYRGAGSSTASGGNFSEAFALLVQQGVIASLTELQGPDVASMLTPAAFDVVVFPGGSGSGEAAGIGADGAKAVLRARPCRHGRGRAVGSWPRLCHDDLL